MQLPAQAVSLYIRRLVLCLNGRLELSYYIDPIKSLALTCQWLPETLSSQAQARLHWQLPVLPLAELPGRADCCQWTPGPRLLALRQLEVRPVLPLAAGASEPTTSRALASLRLPVQVGFELAELESPSLRAAGSLSHRVIQAALPWHVVS